MPNRPETAELPSKDDSVQSMSIGSAFRAKSSLLNRTNTLKNIKLKKSSDVRNSCQNSEPASALVNNLALKSSKTFVVKNSYATSSKQELMSNLSCDNLDARSRVLNAIGKRTKKDTKQKPFTFW